MSASSCSRRYSWIQRVTSGSAREISSPSSARIGTILTYNNEATLQCAIYLAYFAAIEYYTILKETPVGEGIADLIFLPYVPNKPAIIIELKVDQTTNVALKQIDDKHYTQPLDGYHGKLLKVAVNYDRKSKIHQCEIREETI